MKGSEISLESCRGRRVNADIISITDDRDTRNVRQDRRQAVYINIKKK